MSQSQALRKSVSSVSMSRITSASGPVVWCVPLPPQRRSGTNRSRGLSPSRTQNAIRRFAIRSPARCRSSPLRSQPVTELIHSGKRLVGAAIMMNWHIPDEFEMCMYSDAPLWCSPRFA